MKESYNGRWQRLWGWAVVWKPRRDRLKCLERLVFKGLLLDLVHFLEVNYKSACKLLGSQHRKVCRIYSSITMYDKHKPVVQEKHSRYWNLKGISPMGLCEGKNMWNRVNNVFKIILSFRLSSCVILFNAGPKPKKVQFRKIVGIG